MILVVNDVEVELRDGTIADVPLLLSFIRSMAAFEKLTVTATEESLRAALFGEAPAARVLLAFVHGEPVAYATYFFTFASMVGKRGLWLDDLFVTPAFRGQGIGKAFMAYLADVAVRHRCGRLEWMVLDWNETAIGFYERLGASLLPGWLICRLEESQLPGVAGKLTRAQHGEDAVATDENRRPVRRSHNAERGVAADRGPQDGSP
jgi:GNAT superfamily N-acetyltransferase